MIAAAATRSETYFLVAAVGGSDGEEDHGILDPRNAATVEEPPWGSFFMIAIGVVDCDLCVRRPNLEWLQLERRRVAVDHRNAVEDELLARRNPARETFGEVVADDVRAAGQQRHRRDHDGHTGQMTKLTQNCHMG